MPTPRGQKFIAARAELALRKFCEKFLDPTKSLLKIIAWGKFRDPHNFQNEA